jgi:adenylate cyclase
MARGRGFVLIMIVAALTAVYLFASAPPPLADDGLVGERISVRLVFELCSAENAAARKLYTEQIVAAGSKVGLKFDEHWREPDVQAGPLPALFLRETARSLEKLDKQAARLGLFLGSDFPIQPANRFSGAAALAFSQMRKDRAPRFFFMEDVSLHAAMFPDLAVAQACIDCHNRHADSPKNDWQLDDVMGAVTWTYPAASVSVSEALVVLSTLRAGIAAAYGGYLDKARTFTPEPEIGVLWPSSGYSLPTTRVFMDELAQRTSKATLERLLALR